MMYRIVWTVLRVLFKIFLRFRISGAEHIPSKGAVIIASNHISNLDPPVVGTGFWRSAWYMAKEELFANPLAARFISSLYAFPVKRGVPDRAAMKHSLDVLAAGNALVMFPEGTRSETGELGEAEMGVGMIAYRSGAPVVPAYVRGTNEVLPKHGKPRLAPVSVVYGEPITFRMPEGQKPGREDYERAAREIMAAIAALRDRTGG